MVVIKARNANQALPEMMHQILHNPEVRERGSRNGPVRLFSGPCTIQYQRPTERVVFWSERDANPFFHFFESLWMLGGRNDVAYVSRYSSQIGRYSDDGATFHGAYGHRWRRHFKFDQLAHVVERLRANPEDRRCVVSMWDANVDGRGDGKDYPCNLSATFQINFDGELDMVVYNRSNDIVWGALGANCVHFSYLQEFVAAGIGCPEGQYWQVSANMHAYTELTPLLNACMPLANLVFPSTRYKLLDPYHAREADVNKKVTPFVFPLVSTDMDSWHADLRMFLTEGPSAIGYRDPFFRRVAGPMALSYEAFSSRDEGLRRFDHALGELGRMADCDWKQACVEWLLRREAAAKAKQTKQAQEAKE